MEVFGVDAFSPKEVAGRVSDFCVVKAKLPLLTMWMLGTLAGAFIGLGALYFTLIQSDASIGFAAAKRANTVLEKVCVPLISLSRTHKCAHLHIV